MVLVFWFTFSNMYADDFLWLLPGFESADFDTSLTSDTEFWSGFSHDELTCLEIKDCFFLRLPAVWEFLGGDADSLGCWKKWGKCYVRNRKTKHPVNISNQDLEHAEIFKWYLCSIHYDNITNKWTKEVHGGYTKPCYQSCFGLFK